MVDPVQGVNNAVQRLYPMSCQGLHPVQGRHRVFLPWQKGCYYTTYPYTGFDTLCKVATRLLQDADPDKGVRGRCTSMSTCVGLSYVHPPPLLLLQMFLLPGGLISFVFKCRASYIHT